MKRGFFLQLGIRWNEDKCIYEYVSSAPHATISLHHKHNMFSFCSGHHLIGEHNSAYLTHITLLSPHIVHPEVYRSPSKLVVRSLLSY